MAKDKTKSKLSTREKMLVRKENLDKRGSGGNINYIKDGTTRIRLKGQGPTEEIGMEIIQFYLGKDAGGSVISPATFGEPCPFMEKYQKLKGSKKEADMELAKKLAPKRRYLVAGIGYKDSKGKEIDLDKVDKLWQIPRSVYQDIIELYLDEDYGDMTDPDEGYDLKITRSGQGQLDTTYSVLAAPKKPLDPQYQGDVNIESLLRPGMKSYDELEDMLNKFLSISDEDDEEEDEAPRKSKDKLKNKLKKRRGDEDDELPF